MVRDHAEVSARAAVGAHPPHNRHLYQRAKRAPAKQQQCCTPQSRSVPARGGAACPPTCGPLPAPRASADSARERSSPTYCPLRWWWICGWQRMRYLAADAGWNERERSFGPPSATAPRTWSTVTAWMRRTGGMMHSCHAPAFLRRRELSALCVFGADGLKMAHKTIIFTRLSWSRTIASAFRPSRAFICHRIWGGWGPGAPCSSFGTR